MTQPVEPRQTWTTPELLIQGVEHTASEVNTQSDISLNGVGAYSSLPG